MPLREWISLAVQIAIGALLLYGLFAMVQCSRAHAQVRAITGPIAVIVEEEARAAGFDDHGIEMMKRIAAIESSGNPNSCTGSYCGVFQLSQAEFRRHGGGNIFNARDNARATMKLAQEAVTNFRFMYGREPSWTELYLLHQQGPDGLAAHLAESNRLAWRNMASTAEGREKGDGWSRLAIWRNVPSDVKWKFGNVDQITSAQFIEVWRERVEGPRVTVASRPPARECRLLDGRVGLTR